MLVLLEIMWLLAFWTSQGLCGLWRSQSPGKKGSGVPLDCDSINQRLLMVRQLGFGGANWTRTVPTCGQTTIEEVHERAALGIESYEVGSGYKMWMGPGGLERPGGCWVKQEKQDLRW